MRRSTVLAGFSVAVIAAVASGAFAGELTGEEKKWLRQCVDGLKSRSDRMQCGAESAMAALGLDAVPPLVPMLGALDPRDDADWEALTRALFGMGANSAAAALEKDRLTWPKTVAARIDVVVTDLRAGKLKRRGSKDAGAPANDDPAVEAKVIAALEYWETKSEFSSADPRLREITSLGRAAVPALLRYLQNGDHRHMSNAAAAQALEKVATEADVPAIAEALRAGALDAAAALKRFRTPAARDALLDVVARGDMSHDVIEGLQPHARDPLVHRALTTWLRDRGATEEFNTGFVAAFLADNGVADALPEIEKLLDALGSARWQIGRAAALLGAKQGLRVLVEELESPSRVERGPGSSYERHSAGKALNDLTGRDWFTGTYDPFGKESNNAPAAAKRYREWWDSVKETVRFDAATKRWLDS